MIVLPKHLSERFPDVAPKYIQATDQWRHVRRSVTWLVKNIESVDHETMERFKQKVYDPFVKLMDGNYTLAEDFELVAGFLDVVLRALPNKEMDLSFISAMDWVETETQRRIHDRFIIPASTNSP